jgi:hypothetical protein
MIICDKVVNKNRKLLLRSRVPCRVPPLRDGQVPSARARARARAVPSAAVPDPQVRKKHARDLCEKKIMILFLIPDQILKKQYINMFMI